MLTEYLTCQVDDRAFDLRSLATDPLSDGLWDDDAASRASLSGDCGGLPQGSVRPIAEVTGPRYDCQVMNTTYACCDIGLNCRNGCSMLVLPETGHLAQTILTNTSSKSLRYGNVLLRRSSRETVAAYDE